MNYRDLYLELISEVLLDAANRERAAKTIAAEVPIDVQYDSSDAELLTNCEWAIRHVAEPLFYTVTKELEYYVRCLRGEQEFSTTARDRYIIEANNQK